MSIEELGSLGELIAAIATLATLAYLAYQIKQNTVSIQSQSRFHALDTLNADMNDLAQSERWNFSQSVRQGEADEGDYQRHGWIFASWMCHLETMYFDLSDGILPASFAPTLDHRLRLAFGSSPISESYWDEHRPLFTKDFQIYVDDMRERFAAEAG
jgi:hypothetical protein